MQEHEAQVQEFQAGNENDVALQDQVVVLEHKLVESEVTRNKHWGIKEQLEEIDAIL